MFCLGYLTQRRHLNQLCGNILDAFFDPRFLSLPCGTAKFINSYLTTLAAIAGKQINVFNRQIQLISACIDKQNTIMISPKNVQRLKAFITANPMIHMNNQITFVQAGHLTQEMFSPAAFALRSMQTAAENVLFCNHKQLRHDKSVFQWPDHQINGTRHHFIPVCDNMHITRASHILF